MFIFNREKLHEYGVDMGEMFVYLSIPVMRAMVIATKYAYFSKKELADMEKGDAKWSPTKSGRKMLLAGWCNIPRLFPGLLQYQIEYAMFKSDIDLNQVFFRLRRSESVAENVNAKMRDRLKTGNSEKDGT